MWNPRAPRPRRLLRRLEELEDPSLRDKPLVVGGDPHGRGVVSTANYAARAFGIHSAMSAAEALRRCPHAVFLRPRHALYRQYSRVVWDTVGEIVLGSSAPGSTRATSTSATVATDFTRHARSRPPQTAVRGRTSLTCSLGVGTSKVVCKIASDRRKPGGSRSCRREPRPGSSHPCPFACSRRRAALRGEAPRRRARDDRRARRARGRGAATLLPGSLGPLLRNRARGIDPRDLDLELERVSVSAEDTFERDLVERERLHDEVRRLSDLVAERLRNSGLSGRTVTAKLRYTDFSIRTRSTTLPAAVDDASVIGDVACGLLDRGLRDRPGALRLVGVGVSGLSPYRQLRLEES